MTTSKNSGAAVSLKGVIGPAFYETHRLIRAGKIDEAVEKGGRASLKSSYVSVEVVLQLLRHPDCHALVTRQVADTMRDSVYAQILWAMDRICEALDCDLNDLLEYEPNRVRRTGKNLIVEDHGNRKRK